MTTPDSWTLVVLAAGIGSRYGGSKQLDTVGPGGEILSDFALIDAARAGATEAVFVVRAELEPAFREHHVRVPPPLPVRYVHQGLSTLPPGRSKPWGTTHAVLAAGPVLHGPFGVVNADDYYGPEAYAALGNFFAGPAITPPCFALVGYRLSETLSPHGGVSRAIAETGAAGDLVRLREVTGLRQGDGLVAGQRGDEQLTFSGEELVSMNCWAFTAPALSLLRAAFARFLARQTGSATAECPLPDAIQEMMERGEARVRVVPGGRGWFGVTYPADRPLVADRLRQLRPPT